MRSLCVHLIGTLLVLGFLVHEAHGLLLDEVVQEALGRNPEILAARERWEAAKAKKTQVRTWPDPQFGISFEKIKSPNLWLGEARMRMYSISQMIPFPGKLTLRARIAQKMTHKAREEYEAKRREIVARTKRAYFRLFLVHKSIEILEEEMDLIRSFEKVAQVQYAVGRKTQYDVLKAEVELSLVADDIITFRHEELTKAEAELNLLLDRPPRSPVDAPVDFEMPVLQWTHEEIEALALERRQDLQGSRYMVESARIAHTLAKMEYLPDFMVKLSQEHMDMGGVKEVNRGAMFSLEIPLWFWKQRSGVSERRAELKSVEAAYQARRNAVLLEVQQSLAELRSSKRRVDLFKTTVIPLAEQALKAGTTAYETGQIDFLSLIAAERAVKEARLKYHRALANYGENLATLELVVGVSLEEKR